VTPIRRRKVKVKRIEEVAPEPPWLAQEVLPPGIGEADFQEHCEWVARGYGWTVHHNADSRRSDAGLPDLVMLSPVRPDGGVTLALVELKSAKGKPSDIQELWLLKLAQVDTLVTGWIRPAQWPQFLSLVYDPDGATQTSEAREAPQGTEPTKPPAHD
jgi:VRR-NUC domain